MDLGNFRDGRKKNSKFRLKLMRVLYYKYITLDFYFLLFMLYILLLNRFRLINHANILFTSIFLEIHT
jgi:hypothetical protein